MICLTSLWGTAMNKLIAKWRRQDAELYDTNPLWIVEKDIEIEEHIRSLWPLRIIEAKQHNDRDAADYALVQWREKYRVDVYDEHGTFVFNNIFESITESVLFVKSIPPGYQYIRSIV